jgi:hypothetical protein
LVREVRLPVWRYCLQGLESDALAALLQAASCLACLTLPTLAPGITSSKEAFMKAIRLVQLDETCT